LPNGRLSITTRSSTSLEKSYQPFGGSVAAGHSSTAKVAAHARPRSLSSLSVWLRRRSGPRALSAARSILQTLQPASKAVPARSGGSLHAVAVQAAELPPCAFRRSPFLLLGGRSQLLPA